MVTKLFEGDPDKVLTYNKKPLTKEVVEDKNLSPFTFKPQENIAAKRLNNQIASHFVRDKKHNVSVNIISPSP